MTHTISVFQPAQHRHTSLKLRLTHHDTHDTNHQKLKHRQIYCIPTSTTLIIFVRFFSDLLSTSKTHQIIVGNLSSYTPVACSLKSEFVTSKTDTL